MNRTLFIRGVGVLGPGMDEWTAASAVLRNERAFAWSEPRDPRPDILSAGARRRSGLHIRIGVEVAAQALQAAGLPGADLATVFASSDNDGENTQAICMALAASVPHVSPTRFHHSVSNAAAGTWSIAVGSRAPSTTVSAYDWSFAAGLLEAAAQAWASQREVLLVAHDIVAPEPLVARRRLLANFGVALLISPLPQSGACVRMDFDGFTHEAEASRMQHEGLERLRLGNPAAAALPLLRAVARPGTHSLGLSCGAAGVLGIQVQTLERREGLCRSAH